MNFENYICSLKDRLSRYFDLQEGFEFEGMEFDLYAKSFVRNEKYILSKRFTIYGFENNEYCLIKCAEQVDDDAIDAFIDRIKSAVDRFIIPHEEHMSSIVTGVLVVGHTPGRQLINKVKKFKFHKGFAFGFKGWADIRLILVDLSTGEVVTNKKGRDVEKFYRIKE
ncbi:MAG: hypothetical protein HPY66_0040 [Firmicutes bacterium]|nr:hypothetical protein [Bacillota bacterium]